MAKEKPMVVQYCRMKEGHEGCLLFFHLGSFYELFGCDAYVVARVLNLRIRPRSVGGKRVWPMCGIPVASAEGHVKALCERGYRVALCRQVAGECDIKGVVNRAVTEVFEPEGDRLIDLSVYEQEYEAYLSSFEEDQAIREERRVQPGVDRLFEELSALCIDDLSPLDALALLYKWQRKYEAS